MALTRENASEATFELLTKTWGRWGAVDSDVLTHLVNPAFMGGPKWPALRQAYRVVRRPDAILVARCRAFAWSASPCSPSRS